MTRRKILLVLLGLLLLSQTPFAYRRYRLRRLHNAIQQLASQRVAPQTESEYIDYQGVIHVHTFLGGHSTGTFTELISAAKTNQLDFVIMTEHPQAEFDASAMTLNGLHGGVLFINGNEVVTASNDRLLLIPGSDGAAAAGAQPSQEVIDKQKARSGLALVAYPSESQNWKSSQPDGVEVYNLFTNARQSNPLITFFDGVWSYRSYPDLMFANFFSRPTENLKQWDEANAGNRKLVATAGNDAHSNVGLSLNDSSGKEWLGVKLDPYERSFRVVRTHVLIRKEEKLTRESLLEAIALGHCYISFDLFGDPKGFTFSAGFPYWKIMGDDFVSEKETVLTASAPLPSRFVLVRNGSAVDQQSGMKAWFSVKSPGIYRVEVYLDSLPPPATGKPWILSNPIYVR